MRGRPKAKVKRGVISIRLLPRAASWATKQGKRHGISRSQWIENMILNDAPTQQ